MPITYERDDERRRIIVTTIGSVGLEEMLAVVDRQAREGTWRYGMLYDSRRVSSVASPDDVRAGLKHVEGVSRVHGPRGPVAFVTTMPAAYGMVRMYSTLAGHASGGRSVSRHRGCRALARHTHRSRTAIVTTREHPGPRVPGLRQNG